MKIYGIIGYPVKHSLSPVIQNAAFKFWGIGEKCTYKRFEIATEELEEFLIGNISVRDADENKEYKSSEIVGFNVTVPYKIRAKQILEKKFPMDVKFKEENYYVDIAGAINTVKRENGKIEYRNTDVEGFLRAITRKEELGFNLDKESKVLLLGCGGAGRAVIAGLSWNFEDTGIEKIYVYDKSQEAKASTEDHILYIQKKYMYDLENIVQFISFEEIKDVIRDCSLLVNATTLGMKEGDPSVIDKELLHNELSVYDLVYNRETQLVKDAKSLGLRAAGGLGMLLYQGVGALEFWFPGKRPRPVATMEKALVNALQTSTTG